MGTSLLEPMRYKNFIWPHNPRVYTIDFERKMAAHKVPGGRYLLQDLGLTRRVMKGEGEFTGTGAYDQFKALATVFYQEGPGLLVHPLWQTTSAYFVALALRQEPRPDYVSYTFTFWENFDGYSTCARTVSTQAEGSAETSGSADEEAVWYTVVRGDSLWKIARMYGISLSDLLALNPDISNPNLIYPGQEIRVSG